jgi:KGK domain
MSEKFNLSDCADEDVISFGENVYKFGKFRRVWKALNKSSMASELLNHFGDGRLNIDHNCFINGNFYEYEKLFEPGIDCEILRVGAKEWKKGKVKIKMTLELYIEDDESDDNSTMSQSDINQSKSPLDDLREQLKIIENK